LDEFTGVLAFAPMKLIKQENRRERMDRFTMGALGREDQPAAMLRLVVEANAPDGANEDCQEPIRWELRRFQKRLMALIKRDIQYAMQVVGQDETGELTDFLRIVGVEGDQLQKQGEHLIGMIQEVILERVEEIIDNTINGVRVMKQTSSGREPVKTKHGSDMIVEESGLTVRKDENARKPVGALWWLLPFKRHYLNGQIPWRELEWADEEWVAEENADEGVLPPTIKPLTLPTPKATKNAPMLPTDPPQTGDGDDTQPAAGPPPPSEPLSADLRNEIVPPLRAPDPPSINYMNAMNIRIYKLCTQLYDVELGANHNRSNFELESIKLLKAMQAEVASFWAAKKLPLLQSLADINRISREVIEGALRKKLKASGVVDTRDIEDSYSQVLEMIAGNKDANNTGTEGYFFKGSFTEQQKQNTSQELQSLEQYMTSKPNLFNNRRAPWSGGLSREAYLELLRTKTEKNPNMAAFPSNYPERSACRGSWERICEEFLFLVLQLSMRSVTEVELSLAKASCGASLTASPQEIVAKLVLHRLRELGREGGVNFRDRILHAYARDVKNALVEAKNDISNLCPPVAGMQPEEFFTTEMAAYAQRVTDRTIESLQESFDQLVPFDWSSLNGRLPLASSVRGFRSKRWEWQSPTVVEREATDDEIRAMWEMPIREMWKSEDGGPARLSGKMKVGLERDKTNPNTAVSPGRVICTTTVQEEAYQNLVKDVFDRMCREISSDEFTMRPNDGSWSPELAAPRFQETALIVWKAMHCAAIDFCRPRLKKMLSSIYQTDDLRNMMLLAPAHNGKLDFRKMYGGVIEDKKELLSTEEAKLARLNAVVAALSTPGGQMPVDEVPAAYRVEALEQEIAEQKEKAEAAQKLYEQKIKQQQQMEQLLKGDLNNCKPLASMGKKYHAMDSMLATYKLQIDKLVLSQTRINAKNKVWFAGYWFKKEGWWGEGLNQLKPPENFEPYQIMFETEMLDPTGGGFGSVEIREKNLDCNLTSELIHPLATFKIPALFPWHEHCLAVECWLQSKASWGKKKHDQLFTVVIPLAYVLRPSKRGDAPIPNARSKQNLWEDIENFKFEDEASMGFEVKEDGDSRDFLFSENKGLLFEKAVKSDQSLMSDISSAKFQVTIKQKIDSTDFPLLMLSKEEMKSGTFQPPSRA